MKRLNSARASLMVLGLAALLGTAPANAQTKNMRFEIPFQFVAADQVLPAGQYEIRLDHFPRMLLRLTTDSAVHVVRLSPKCASRSRTGLEKAKLQFTRYAQTLLLTAVWASGNPEGRTVASSPRLIEAASAAGNAQHALGAALETP